jgi:hypothetical protein
MRRKQSGLMEAVTESGLGLAKAVTSVVTAATDYLTPSKGKASSKQQRQTSPQSRVGKLPRKRKAAGAKGTTGKGGGRNKRKTASQTKS